MAKRSKGRALNGVLLLDKASGLSSNRALQRVKRIFGASKAGHTGSLDPLATGMLPICFGEATKFSQHMLEADKSYLAKLKLGIRTASGDSESEVIARRDVSASLDEELVNGALKRFVGEIKQIPSMYSALKYNGQPLYKLAREGIEVERQARAIIIRQLKLLWLKGDELAIELDCSKGTYVRSLADDLGETLGCGAHVIELRRTAVKGFAGQTMHSEDELERIVSSEENLASSYAKLDELLLPITALVGGLPQVELNDALSHYLMQGQPVFVPNISCEGKVALLNKDADNEQRRFIGVGEILDDGRVAPRRLVVTA